MKRYDSYKDSGIEWIGEIPSHWEHTRIKFTVNEKGSIFIDGDWIESKVIIEEGIRYITTGNVKVGCYSEQGSGYISNQTFKDLNCTEVFEGDLIISRLNYPIGRACIVPNLNSRIVTSVDNVIYRPDKNLNKKFLLHLFSSKQYFEHTELISRGATMQRISRGMLGNLKIPLPTSDEQIAIANYLDQKTAQIDELIAKKERLIQLLEEERTALINQAVTKGIDPTVPMKDSGIEWLGEIPEHWEVTKIKTVTKKIGSGVTPKGGAEIYELSGIPLLRSQNIYFDGFRLENVAYITSEIHDSMKNSQVQLGDVLLNITGGSIGRCFYVTDEFSEANVNQHVCIVRPNNRIITEFLYYVLSSSIGQHQIDLCQTGGNREALNFEQLKNFFLCLPEVEGQKSIVQQLSFKLNSIKLAVEKIRKEIELLKEYKTALISEVVTGKVDVRNEILN